MIDVNAVVSRIRPILAEVRTVAMDTEGHPRRMAEPVRAVPFITISRETGAGAWTLAQHLVEHLKAVDPGEPPWSCWDRELIEKVSEDAHISRQLVESLEGASHSWIEEFFSEMSAARQYPSEAAVYKKVVKTIRALAQVGRVVVVGMGSNFVTRDMPGGIHVRLISPLEHRIRHIMEYLKVDHKAAAAHVAKTDANRHAFYRRYWPNQLVSCEMFTMTLNASMMNEEQAISAIEGMIRRPKAAHAAPPAMSQTHSDLDGLTAD